MQIALIILGCILWYVVGVVSTLYMDALVYGKVKVLDLILSLFFGITGPIVLVFIVMGQFSNSDCNKTVYTRKGK
ncbi:MAG TPA: hypothetical protein VMW36_02095 [Patescibacteria group bacterium]|nr:hypothetical protein [Patescibacteria group bacterium]